MADVDRVRREAARQGNRRPDRLLAALGILSEAALANAYAELLEQSIPKPIHYPSHPLLPRRLTSTYLRAQAIVPLELLPGTLTVAMGDPLDDFAVAAIGAATSLTILVEIATPAEVAAEIERLYPRHPNDRTLPDEAPETDRLSKWPSDRLHGDGFLGMLERFVSGR